MYKTLVFWWESFLILPPSPLSRCSGMFRRSVSQTGNIFDGILQRILFFVFLSKHLYFSLLGFDTFFCSCFCSVVFEKEEADLPVDSRWFSLDSQNHSFISPLWSPGSTRFASPSVVCLLILTWSPFGRSWGGTECKREHTRSQECNCLHSRTGTKSISLPFWPLHFFPPKRSNPRRWDLGLREQETRDASCTVFSEDDFCSRCLVKALPS